MQNGTCYILAMIKRDDGERLLLGAGYYEFTREQKHFNPNQFQNDIVELQGTDGQLLAGQVRRSTSQPFDGYIGDGTTPKDIVEQKRREFFLFFRKQHHYTVVYIMPDGSAIKRDRGYITDAPAVQELYQVQPKWHVALAFEDVNYYSYAEDDKGNEIYSFDAELGLANIEDGGLIFDDKGAISTGVSYGIERVGQATGNPIEATITSKAAQFSNMELLGETSQDTTTGKNLLHVIPITGAARGCTVNMTDDGLAHVKGICNASWVDLTSRSTAIAFPAGTYTLSLTIPNSGHGTVLRCYTVETGGSYTDYAIGKDNKSTTFTTTSAIKSAYIWLSGTAAGQVIDNTFGIMLESGSTATAWEQYTGGSAGPNPNGPIKVKTVTGTQIVRTVGKNILDPFAGSNGSINGGNGSISRDERSNIQTTETFIRIVSELDYHGFVGEPVDCTPNEKLTLSWTRHGETTVQYIGIFFYDKNGSFLKRDTGVTTGDGSLTSTVPANAAKAVAYLSARYAGQVVTFYDVMLERSAAKTAFEPYRGIDHPLQLGNIELCKLGDYQDRIFKDGASWKIQKKVGKKVLDGSESLTVTGEAYYTFVQDAYSLAHTEESVRYGTIDYISSNYFGVEGLDYLFNDDATGITMAHVGTGDSRLIFNITGYTADQLKAWLASNKPNLYYALATTTTTTITDKNLIHQLDAIASARLEHGANTITATSENLGATMDADWIEFDPATQEGGYVWAPSSGGGPVIVTVNGVDSANPVWHVYGPATNPTLTNSSTGEALTWNNTVPANQELIIDMGNQTATLEGANVFEFVSGSWIQLKPGQNRISYTAANTIKSSRVYWNEVVG